VPSATSTIGNFHSPRFQVRYFSMKLTIDSFDRSMVRIFWITVTHTLSLSFIRTRPFGAKLQHSGTSAKQRKRALTRQQNRAGDVTGRRPEPGQAHVGPCQANKSEPSPPRRVDVSLACCCFGLFPRGLTWRLCVVAVLPRAADHRGVAVALSLCPRRYSCRLDETTSVCFSYVATTLPYIVPYDNETETYSCRCSE
jgi:hypothetical protein